MSAEAALAYSNPHACYQQAAQKLFPNGSLYTHNIPQTPEGHDWEPEISVCYTTLDALQSLDPLLESHIPGFTAISNLRRDFEYVTMFLTPADPHADLGGILRFRFNFHTQANETRKPSDAHIGFKSPGKSSDRIELEVATHGNHRQSDILRGLQIIHGRSLSAASPMLAKAATKDIVVGGIGCVSRAGGFALFRHVESDSIVTLDTSIDQAIALPVTLANADGSPRILGTRVEKEIEAKNVISPDNLSDNDLRTIISETMTTLENGLTGLNLAGQISTPDNKTEFVERAVREAGLIYATRQLDIRTHHIDPGSQIGLGKDPAQVKVRRGFSRVFFPGEDIEKRTFEGRSVLARAFANHLPSPAEIHDLTEKQPKPQLSLVTNGLR